MDNDQLRLGADLLTALRTGVTIAVEHAAEFVAPPHMLLGLLADPDLGPVIAPLVPRERIEKAAADAVKKLPEVAQVVEPDDAHAPFPRYDTLAFRSLDGTRTLYLDNDAYHVFIEGARRAVGTYRTKHLIYGFTAEAVKDRDLLSLFGSDPQSVQTAVEPL